MSDPADAADLLPPNATPFERSESSVSARILDTDTNIIRRARDPFATPSNILPFLAAERSVHHYTGTNEALDRASTASSFADHIAYGSPDALEAEIALDLALSIRIVEFNEEPGMEWPDFFVEALIDPGDAAPDIDALWSSAIRRKNVRDWPSRLRVFGRQPPGTDWFGAGVSTSPCVRILPEDALPPPPTFFAGAGTHAQPKVRVRPL